MNDQPDPNNPESVERTMLDPAERISVTTPMPQPIDDLHEVPAPSPAMTETVAATEPVVSVIHQSSTNCVRALPTSDSACPVQMLQKRTRQRSVSLIVGVLRGAPAAS